MRKPRDIGMPLNRRAFFRGTLAFGGGMLLSGMIPGLPGAQADTKGVFISNAFIRIDRGGGITLIMRHAEMGQGIYTGIAMLIAEELEVDLEQVTLEAAPADPSRYTDSAAGEEVTGGSASTRDTWLPLRQAGAAARIMLVAAAASRWKVPPESCAAQHGQIIHVPTGRTLSYGDLAEEAALQKVPEKITLKDPSTFRLIGTSPQRLDTKSKSNGTAIFGMDVRVPGMKIGRIMASPVQGGRLISYDRVAARAIAGVVDIITLQDVIAVIGDHSWAAIKGLEAANPQWDSGPHANVSTKTLLDDLRKASDKTGLIAKAVGDVDAALASCAHRIDAVYELPFLAHAALEPINTTLHIRPDGADVWVGTQVPVRARQEVASATGLPPEKIAIHNHVIGGGFGRRLDSGSIGQAARLAKQVPYPVKLFWTREEDIQQDQFRPFYYDRISAGLDKQGRIAAWKHRTTGSYVTARWAPEGLQNGLDTDTVDGAVETPYDIPVQRNESVQCEPEGLTTLWWRGVGPTHNVFVVESMMDELAHLAETDPLDFRRSMLGHSPRGLKVLNEAAKKSGWGTPLPSGHGRGIALHYSFQTWAATVLEVQITDDNAIRLVRADTAVDCGPVVFPDAVRAQIQGGLIFGLTMALYNEITVTNGRVDQSNFHDYRMMRINEAPDIRVHLVPDLSADIGGIGEVGTVAAAPALANAIFAATGHRLRKIPFVSQMVGKSA
ncbi:xanthine dehydrogenase family protein molybdopterin-binding subunit [Gluconobacter frateurii]|uniref:xanthine dehydrogenase family protein molybdopterin-binding subunit n=1 Tax=Gluconobacter frateurii TaxID=38308 RepID=UPI001F0691F7|nr:xanthine dehydrogenase family protein molybdopterin-binding subunit [Gluconobacter frateurii]UMM08034.1 xanthine dehydrogenase family protein molybdopterin-binding subunit [Gluconobacter frateurii]